jgi:hypothetical protein
MVNVTYRQFNGSSTILANAFVAFIDKLPHLTPLHQWANALNATINLVHSSSLSHKQSAGILRLPSGSGKGGLAQDTGALQAKNKPLNFPEHLIYTTFGAEIQV